MKTSINKNDIFGRPLYLYDVTYTPNWQYNGRTTTPIDVIIHQNAITLKVLHIALSGVDHPTIEMTEYPGSCSNTGANLCLVPEQIYNEIDFTEVKNSLINKVTTGGIYYSTTRKQIELYIEHLSLNGY